MTTKRLHGSISQLASPGRVCRGNSSASPGSTEGCGLPRQGELRAPSAVTLPVQSRTGWTPGHGRRLRMDTRMAQLSAQTLDGASPLWWETHVWSLHWRRTGCQRLLAYCQETVGIKMDYLLPLLSFLCFSWWLTMRTAKTCVLFKT